MHFHKLKNKMAPFNVRHQLVQPREFRIDDKIMKDQIIHDVILVSEKG